MTRQPHPDLVRLIKADPKLSPLAVHIAPAGQASQGGRRGVSQVRLSVIFRPGSRTPDPDSVARLSDNDIEQLLGTLVSMAADTNLTATTRRIATKRLGRLLNEVSGRDRFRGIAPRLRRVSREVGPTAAARKPAAQASKNPGSPAQIKPSRTTPTGKVPPRKGAKKSATRGGGTRTAFARLEAPAAVAPGAEFEVMVGLAAEPNLAITADTLEVPTGTFILRISVTTPGFQRVSADPMPISLKVTPAEPFPSTPVRLIALDDPGLHEDRTISATFFTGNRLLGQAVTLVRVAGSTPTVDQSRGSTGTARPTGSPGTGVAQPAAATKRRRAAARTDRTSTEPDHTSAEGWPVPGDRVADLTILVTRDASVSSGGEDRFLWDFGSPHRSVGYSAESVPGLLPDRARFAAEFRTKMEDLGSHGKVPDDAAARLLQAKLYGLAGHIADAIPDQIWDAIRAAAAAVAPKPPTLLFVTADAYLPWELAAVVDPWLADAAPILAGQAAIGRWSTGLTAQRLHDLAAASSHATSAEATVARHPAPPTRLDAATMDVVAGDYASDALTHADEESSYLQSVYGASETKATAANIVQSLTGQPTPHVLHLAVHGEIDEMGMADGLIMPDGGHVDADTIAGAYAVERPDQPVRLVFVNACEVGQGREVLGSITGIPTALLRLGVGAVIAARWRVNDAVAKEAAQTFYRGVLGTAPISPAEQLRRAFNRAWHAGMPVELSSHGAYLYFGHPAMTISWKGARYATTPAG